MLRACAAVAKPFNRQLWARSPALPRVGLQRCFTSTTVGEVGSTGSPISADQKLQSVFQINTPAALKAWKDKLLQEVKLHQGLEGMFESELLSELAPTYSRKEHPEDYIYSSAIQLLSMNECLDAAYALLSQACLAGRILDTATFELLIKLMAQQDYDASYILWATYLMANSGLSLSPKILQIVVNLKKNKRTNLREYESVLKKLHGPQSTQLSGTEIPHPKLKGAWLGQPYRSNTELATKLKLDTDKHAGRNDEPDMPDSEIMDYEKLTSQLSSSKGTKLKNLGEDLRNKEEVGDPSEMVYFPKNGDQAIPISLAGMMKGASTSAIEKRITNELSRYDGKIEGNLVTSYKELKDGELAVGANNFFEGMKKFEAMLGQTKMVLITPKAFHVRDAEGNILFTVEDIEEDEEGYSDFEDDSEAEIDLSEDEGNNGKNKPK